MKLKYKSLNREIVVFLLTDIFMLNQHVLLLHGLICIADPSSDVYITCLGTRQAQTTETWNPQSVAEKQEQTGGD